MKLLRILFYQAYHLALRHPDRKFAPSASSASVCAFISFILTLWSIIILIVGYHILSVNHLTTISLRPTIIPGAAMVALSVVYDITLWLAFGRHKKYLRIIEDRSYDTRANRIFYYIFHYGPPTIMVLGFIYFIIVAIMRNAA